MPYNPVTKQQDENAILYRNAYEDDGSETGMGGKPRFRVMTYCRDDGESVTVALDPETMEQDPAGHPIYPGPTYTGDQEYGASLWNQEQHYGLLLLGEMEWDDEGCPSPENNWGRGFGAEG